MKNAYNVFSRDLCEALLSFCPISVSGAPPARARLLWTWTKRN